MAQALPQGLASEIKRTTSSVEYWYIEIDSDNLGTLKLCQAGKVTDPDAHQWLIGVTNAHDGETAVQDATFILNAGAERRIAAEPLENHVCRIYRYRSSWNQRQLIRTGRVWSNNRYTGSENQYSFRVVSDLATAINGEVPNRLFTLEKFPQLPEEYQNRAIPIGFGSVKGWTPILAKAGGWGYLSEDITPFSQSEFGGTIPLSDNRYRSFSLHVAGSTTITEQLHGYQNYVKVGNAENMLGDLGTGYVVVRKSGPQYELIHAVGMEESTNHLYPVYRSVFQNDYFLPASDFPVGSVVWAVGLIQIDSEIMLYRYAANGSLAGIIGGLNAAPQPHYAGALVREYAPVYKWIVSAQRAKSLDRRDVKFFLGSDDRLINNPFPDTIINTNDTSFEQGESVCSIQINSLIYSQRVGMNEFETPEPAGHEIITMDNVSIEDDPESRWSNPSNLNDETSVDPYASPPDIPTTATSYLSPGVNEQVFYGGAVYYPALFPEPGSTPDYVFRDIEDAADGNDLSHCQYYTLSPVVIDFSMILVFENLAVENVADVISVSIGVNAGHAGFAAWRKWEAMYNDTVQQLSTEPLSWDEDYEIFNIDGINSEMADFFRSASTYTEQAIGIKFSGKRAPPNDITTFYWSNIRIKIVTRQTSETGNIICSNSTDASHLDDVYEAAVYAYLSQGLWRLTYDEGGTYEAEIEHDMYGDGWNYLPILTAGIPGQSAYKKNIRIYKVDSAESGEVYDCKMMLSFAASGTWTNLHHAIDGDRTTYALFTASLYTYAYAEFRHSGVLSSPTPITGVRIRVRTNWYLFDTAEVGIQVAGQQHLSVTQWYSVGMLAGDEDVYVDVTGSPDGPGVGNWSWSDLDSDGGGGEYAIYLRIRGQPSGIFRLYDVSWDVLTGASGVNPLTTPIVVDYEAKEDVIGGPYGGGLIENPAMIYKFVLLNQASYSSAKIDSDAFDLLADHFDGLSDNGVRASVQIFKRTQADSFLERFRKEFNFVIDDVSGILTPRYYPSIDDDATATFDESNIIAGSFKRKQTPMDQVINYPEAQFAQRYYSSSRDQAILFGTQQRESSRIRKIWNNQFGIESTNDQLRKNWRSMLSIEALNSTSWSDYWDMAYASYQAYGQWFYKSFKFEFIYDSDSAKAMLAQVVQRYARQRWIFQFKAFPGTADFVNKYDVVWVSHRIVPVIPDKTERHTDGNWKVKCAVLDVSTSRVVTVEVL